MSSILAQFLMRDNKKERFEIQKSSGVQCGLIHFSEEELRVEFLLLFSLILSGEKKKLSPPSTA